MGLVPSSWTVLAHSLKRKSGRSHLFLLGLILVILAGIFVLLILVILIIEVTEVVLIELLKGEGLASEPVDGPGNQLLLDVLTELVVELQAVLNIRGSIIIIVRRRLRGREEVEEGLGRDRLLDDAGLLGGCVC